MSAYCRLVLVWFIVLLHFGLCNADARPLTEAEVTTLQGHNSDKEAAQILAMHLGEEPDLDVIPLLLELNDSPLVDSFFRGYRSTPQANLPDPQLDALTSQLVTSPELFRNTFSTNAVQWGFLYHATRYPSRESWQKYYQVMKRAYAENALNPGYRQAGINWNIVFVILPNDLPDIEESIAAFLPLMHDGCQGGALLAFLGKHHYAPAIDRMRDLYMRAQASNPNRGHECISEITYAIAALQTRSASDFLVQRLRWTLEQTPIDWIDADPIFEVLGSTRMEAQIDYENLAHDILSKQHDPKDQARLEMLFRREIEQARRAREFTSNNLFYWLTPHSLNHSLVSSYAALVQSFIEHGVNLDGADGTGTSPLCRAVNSNEFEIVHLLAKGGANVNRSGRGRGECLPLGIIASKDNVSEAAYLLAHGAHVDDYDSVGWTSLHRATEAGNVPMMKLLLAHGANVNAKVNTPHPGGDVLRDNATSLHFAVSNFGYQGKGDEVIRVLLEHKSDVNARTAAGATPLAIAVFRRYQHVLMMRDRQQHPRLPQPGERNTSTEYLSATLSRSENLVRILIDRGADVSLGYTDQISEVTPIIIAHEMGDGKMEELLKSKGAFLNPLVLAKRKAMMSMGTMMGPGH